MHATVQKADWTKTIKIGQTKRSQIEQGTWVLSDLSLQPAYFWFIEQEPSKMRDAFMVGIGQGQIRECLHGQLQRQKDAGKLELPLAAVGVKDSSCQGLTWGGKQEPGANPQICT